MNTEYLLRRAYESSAPTAKFTTQIKIEQNGAQAFIVGFPTEMFGDRQGMPYNGQFGDYCFKMSVKEQLGL